MPTARIAFGRERPTRLLPILGLSLCCLSATTVAARGGPGQQAVRYTGRLNDVLAPTETLGLEKAMTPATEAERRALPTPPDPTDEVFVGSLRIWSPRGLQLAFVKPAKGPACIYADTNSDGVFEASERHVLGPDPGKDPDVEGVVTLQHPLANSRYTQYPVRIAVIRDGPNRERLRPASSMEMVFAEGVVEIDGRRVAVTYTFDTRTGSVNPGSGWLGMDCDGDGKIDRGPTSSEYRLAKDEVVVFRVGERYVSTESVDVASGAIVLRGHAASSYASIELGLGKTVPDFPFTDLDGRRRSFSEFRGKYVLLDFWATWCGPCVAEIPFLAAAYDRYRGKGFEILGLNADEDLAAARRLVAERGVAWPQATRESVKGRLAVFAYPTTVLVDPAGTIVSMGSRNELRGKALDATLEKLLASRRP